MACITLGRHQKRGSPASPVLLGPGLCLRLPAPAPSPGSWRPSCCIARNFSSSSLRAASVSCTQH